MADANPYVGPTSFEEKNSANFFGRDDETRELVSLIIARRAVLLYAQSGAGKTSLLKASVIPSLKRRKRMDVFPIARVAGAVTPGEGNVYVANALAHLTGTVDSTGQTLRDTIGPLLETGSRSPRLLAFDQFEEIFTWYPGRFADRKDFFQQLNECLTEYPQLSLLLSMREDYLADLDSLAGFLPDRMRTRMRLERLPYKAAVAAVSKPAALAGKPFAEGVAEALVDNLRRVQTARGRQRPADDNPAHVPLPGGDGSQVLAEPRASASGNVPLGKYVEPVQLQIVCWQLWSHLPNEASTITAREVEKYGDVDDALTKFYRDALAQAQKETGVTERTLRRWFSEELITPAHTRGLVYQGETDTAGLPNEAVHVLRQRYIIRPDIRGDWFELAHDRLVEPILEDNHTWRASYRNPVADAYERWVSGGRDPRKLLNGNQLAEARVYAAEHPRELNDEERKFLDTSVEEEKRLKRRRRTFVLTGTAVGLAVAGLAVWALVERRNATEALVMVQKASSRLQLQETARIWHEKPDEALAYAEQALRADPTSLIARSWVSTLLLRQNWWMPGPTVDPPEVSPGAKATGLNHGVAFVDFSPDSRRFATASDTIVAFWDAETGQPAGQPIPHPNYVSFVKFSPDGRRVVTFGSEFIVRVWDVESGRSLFEKQAPVEIVFAVFSPDGNRIVTVNSDVSAQVWDLGTGQARAVVQEQTSRMYSAAFSPDGRELVTYSLGLLSRWDPVSGNRISSAIRLPLGVSFAAFSSDARRVVTAHPNWTVGITDVTAGAEIGASMKHPGLVLSAALSRDGRYVVTASDDNAARLWEADTGRFLGIVGRHNSRVLAVALSPDGRKAVTASEDCTARIWETLSGQPLASPGEDRTYGIAQTPRLQPELEQVRTLKISSMGGGISPDGTRLIAIDADQAAQVWEIESGKAVGPALRHDEGITSVTFSPDGRRILTASPRSVRLWDARNGAGVKTIRPDSTQFFSAFLRPDGRHIITAGVLGQILDAESGKPIVNLNAASGHHIISASFSRDGNRMVTSSSNGTITLYGETQPDQRRAPAELIPLVNKSFPVETQGTISAVFSPDGQRVVSGGADNRAIIWDANTRRPIGRPLEHGDVVYSASFSADGQQVVTASLDGTARVWDASSGQPMGMPVIHRTGVVWAGFLPDGQRIATVATDGAARLWTVLLGDGTQADTLSLTDLAKALSGGTGQPHANRARCIQELRANVFNSPSGQQSLSLRKLLGSHGHRQARQAGSQPND